MNNLNSTQLIEPQDDKQIVPQPEPGSEPLRLKRHEAFAQAVALHGLTQTEAYLHVGYQSSTRQIAAQAASALARRPVVSARIRWLRENAPDAPQEMSEAEQRQVLTSIIRRASPADRIRALELLRRIDHADEPDPSKLPIDPAMLRAHISRRINELHERFGDFHVAVDRQGIRVIHRPRKGVYRLKRKSQLSQRRKAERLAKEKDAEKICDTTQIMRRSETTNTIPATATTPPHAQDSLRNRVQNVAIQGSNGLTTGPLASVNDMSMT